MNLLDTASLVVTPNGYKASKLYSIIPSDGTGDMTFARTGDTATRVNSSGLIETVLANKPRLDYTSSTCPKLLLEPQRTNLSINSNAFNLWSVSGSPTVTADYAVSPDGGTNADRVQFSAATDLIYSSSVGTTGQTNTISVYAKSTSGSNANFRFFGNGNLTISTDQVATNVWQRFTFSYSCTAVTAGLRGASTGTSDIIFYGYQHEAGAYATSYIPTTTASVTRNVDVCSKTSATALIGQTEGTLFFDGIAEGYQTTLYGTIVLDLNLNANNDRYIHFLTNKSIRFSEYAGGTTTALIETPANYIVNGARYKIAVAYKANDFVMYVNGVQIGTDTNGAIFGADKLYLGYYSSGFESLNKYNSIALWKTRLTNQELITLTTI